MNLSDAMRELRRQAEQMSVKAQKDAAEAARELDEANAQLASVNDALLQEEAQSQSLQV